MNLVEKLQKKRPKSDVVFIAIDNLKTKEEVIQFYQDYVEYMKSKNFNERVAQSNIGYVLGYYSEKEHKLWYGNLEQVSHPAFGSTFGR